MEKQKVKILGISGSPRRGGNTAGMVRYCLEWAEKMDYVETEYLTLADLSSVKYIFCAGEALSPELFHSFKETFGKTLYNCWGAQELASAPLSWQFGEEVPPEKIGSAGKSPCLGIEVKIVDENGKEVENGVTGEIMLKAKSKFITYWHEPEEAAGKIFEGWYKPGDTFMRDEDGYYWYKGRLDDMVKVGGRPVFPVEVEHTVACHPVVLEAAVIPVKNEMGLVEIHAFTVLREGRPGQIFGRCSGRCIWGNRRNFKKGL